MTDENADETTGEVADFVPFRTARTPFEARVIAVVLESAGIPAMTPDGMLADEFAASQRLMNLQSVKVLVPRARLADAEAALAEAKRVGAEMGEDADGGESIAPAAAPVVAQEGPRRSYGVPALLFGAASLALLVAWLETKAALAAMVASPLYTTRSTADGWRYARADGTTALEMHDADHDGFVERTSHFDLRGRRSQVLIDSDQNGVIERQEGYGPDGSLVAIAEDHDQDGRIEVVRELYADDVEIVYRDADADGRFERLELRGAGGELRVIQELDLQRGFVTR